MGATTTIVTVILIEVSVAICASDAAIEDELLELFMTLREHGVTILFSTHITSDLEKCADNIVYISRGEIKAADSKENFERNFGKPGETLEEIFLRLEKEARS